MSVCVCVEIRKIYDWRWLKSVFATAANTGEPDFILFQSAYTAMYFVFGKRESKNTE